MNTQFAAKGEAGMSSHEQRSDLQGVIGQWVRGSVVRRRLRSLKGQPWRWRGSLRRRWWRPFYLDGRFVAITNVAPFRFSWDSANAAAGEHTLKVVVTNASDRP